MQKVKINETLLKVKKDKIAFVELQFTDFFGNIKNSTIPVHNLKNALTRGVWIDGSSIQGFARIHESDMYLMPDPDSYALLPWRNHKEDGRVVRFICDVFKPDNTPFEGDPRYILKNAIKEAQSMGFRYLAGPECEFFLFKKDENGLPLVSSKGNGYYFNLILDDTYEIKREIVETLFAMGIITETSTYEVADNQHELDIRYDEALKIADSIITLKMAVKFIAYKHKLHATFMPKPIFGINGSGMHTHQSLWQGDRNVFYDRSDKYMLSGTAYSFMAGQLYFAREMASVLASSVNSYKRLTPGYEAPVYVSWARINRSALIRVPNVSKGYEDKATRIEIRCPDPSGNPYLALAVLLKSGLRGIKKKMKAPKPIEENLFEFDDARLREAYISKLPENLKEALDLSEKGEIVRETMGKETFQRYMDAKRKEWDLYRISVSKWELDRYIHSM